MPVFSYTRCSCNVSPMREAGSATSGTPAAEYRRNDSHFDGIDESFPARLRKSDPPPNSQMSLPGSPRSDCTSAFQFSPTIVTFL